MSTLSDGGPFSQKGITTPPKVVSPLVTLSQPLLSVPDRLVLRKHLHIVSINQLTSALGSNISRNITGMETTPLHLLLLLLLPLLLHRAETGVRRAVPKDSSIQLTLMDRLPLALASSLTASRVLSKMSSSDYRNMVQWILCWIYSSLRFGRLQPRDKQRIMRIQQFDLFLFFIRLFIIGSSLHGRWIWDTPISGKQRFLRKVHSQRIDQTASLFG